MLEQVRLTRFAILIENPHMALQATPYKIELSLIDMDRNLYDTLRFSMARHPSETAERLLARLLARAIWHAEQVEFGRGLAHVEDAAVWQKSLDGRILHWVEVGQPNAERMTWCSRQAEQLSVLAYGSLRTWLSKELEPARNLKNLNVLAISPASLAHLAVDVPRSINWSVMISDGDVFVTDERGQHSIELEWLHGERC